jgi:hypothetical protein
LLGKGKGGNVPVTILKGMVTRSSPSLEADSDIFGGIEGGREVVDAIAVGVAAVGWSEEDKTVLS